MKNIITTAIFTTIAMFAFSALQAQSESKYRTDIPISQQIKKGLVPGAQFAPTTTQLNLKPQPVPAEANIRESYSAQLKKGTLPGMRVQAGSGTAKSVAAPKTAATNVALPSSVAPSKEESKKEALKPAASPYPSQDDKGTPKANN